MKARGIAYVPGYVVNAGGTFVNRIKGLLFAQGIRRIEPKQRSTKIDFSGLRTADGHRCPTGPGGS